MSQFVNDIADMPCGAQYGPAGSTETSRLPPATGAAGRRYRRPKSGGGDVARQRDALPCCQQRACVRRTGQDCRLAVCV